MRRFASLLPAPASSLLPCAVLAWALSGHTMAAPAPLPNCSAAEHRQFDFWRGDWSVTTADGKTVLGESHVLPILDGCVLHEHWRGAKGGAGESFNIYNRETGGWQQNWVDISGSALRLDGGLKNGAMVLEGSHRVNGGVSIERISWTALADGRVNQRWETSTDGGKSWLTSFDGYYQRLSPQPGSP